VNHFEQNDDVILGLYDSLEVVVEARQGRGDAGEAE
jgi:hypothetical protein